MIPKTETLRIPELLKAAAALPAKGKLAIADSSFVYLDIGDEYIHRLYPLLQTQEIKKPNYFGANSVGAHITVVYPEENTGIDKKDLQSEHEFFIKKLIAAEIGQKTYYALLVESDSLLALRKKYRMSDLLCFKGYSIGFHITIGVK